MTATLCADPIISEFLAANKKNLADADGDYSDWIEIHNPDAAPVDLDGWYLTDSAGNKDRWKFPAVILPAGGYLVVHASGKNRRDPTKPLHTNFSIEAEGEYLALVKPDGTTVTSEFAPKFPVQYEDISYGLAQPAVAGQPARHGYFRSPTPGAQNGSAAAMMPTERVTFSRAAGPFVGSFTLTLSGASAGQRIRYVVSPTSTAGALPVEPAAASSEYTGPVTISASSLVTATVFSSDSSQRGFPTTVPYLRIGNTGADRLDTFSSQMPLLMIDLAGVGSLSKETGEKSALFYCWERPSTGGTAVTAAPSVFSFGTVNVRGASSSDFPKRSYSIKLTDAAGTPIPQPLYGLPAFDNWTLIGPWNYDRTLIHNVFTYELSNRLGRWAPRTQLVELFINGYGDDLDNTDYAGIYVLTDPIRVDPKRVAITAIGSGDTGARTVTGGYLVKCDLPDSDEFSFQSPRAWPGLPFAITVSHPKLPAMPKAQRDYIQGYFQGFENALYADYNVGFSQRTYLDYIDRGSWVDHHLLNTFTSNVDAFFRSAYMVKEREGRLSAGPMWDNDRSMDGGDYRTKRTDVWSGPDGATNFWADGWFAVLARDPEFMQAWIDRWHSLRSTEFSTTSLTTLVDSIASRIGVAAATRDAVRWPDNTSRFGADWQGEINNMKTWLTARAAWIDAQFTAPPTLTSAGGSLSLTPAAGTQLIYTTDGSDPRLIGGGISPKARTSTTRVTLADTTNLQARSYAAGVDPTVVPSSRWSGRVAGPRAGDSPIARLANLSILTSITSSTRNFTVGTVIGGQGTGGPKPLLVRAGGPSLAALGVTGALPDPRLELFRGQTSIDSNNDWDGDATLAAAFAKVGAFAYAANSSKDAAIFSTGTPAGNYTVQVTGGSTGTGTVIAELYDATPNVEFDSTTPRLINVSVLKQIDADETLTAGFVIGGTAAKQVLVRAVGPTLADAPFNVAGAMPNPRIDLFSGSSVTASNDDWGGGATLSAAFAAVGAFALPANSRDAALLVTLQPGNYTAQVGGVGGSSGVALVEVYEVP